MTPPDQTRKPEGTEVEAPLNELEAINELSRLIMIARGAASKIRAEMTRAGRMMYGAAEVDWLVNDADNFLKANRLCHRLYDAAKSRLTPPAMEPGKLAEIRKRHKELSMFNVPADQLSTMAILQTLSEAHQDRATLLTALSDTARVERDGVVEECALIADAEYEPNLNGVDCKGRVLEKDKGRSPSWRDGRNLTALGIADKIRALKVSPPRTEP